MTYLAVWEMSRDTDLQGRLSAAAAMEAIDWPEGWVNQRRWLLVARTDWAAAWAYATAAGTPNPGRAPNVITDQMILSSVQEVTS